MRGEWAMHTKVVRLARSVLVLIVAFGGCGPDQRKIQYDQQRFASQLADVVGGKTHNIYFYETTGTDALLAKLRGVPGVESLRLDLTDVSDDGMRHVATLPHLKKLILYGGRLSVGDSGLAHLKTLASLQTLELINTRVTDEGLAVLKRLARATFAHALSGSMAQSYIHRRQRHTPEGLDEASAA